MTEQELIHFLYNLGSHEFETKVDSFFKYQLLVKKKITAVRIINNSILFLFKKIYLKIRLKSNIAK